MIEIISFAYITVQFISLAMSWPQVHQLLVLKQADELSLSTWSMWLTAQSVTTLYAAVSHQLLWLIMSVIWLVFDVVMVALIIKYQGAQKLQLATELVSEDDSVEI